MDDIAVALTPILALILLGFVLSRMRFLPEEFWSGVEKLTYYILFPSLLVGTLGAQNLAGTPWPAMMLVVFGTLTAVVVALVLWHCLRGSVSGPTFTSIFQGGVRFNTYIALAIVQAFFGAEGLAMGAVAAGFMIIVINLLCIAAFVIWGGARTRGFKPIVGAVFGNPLILACVLGWALSLSGIGLPGITENVLEIIGRAALPFGLLAVGAALRPAAIRGHIGPASISIIVQFGLKPLLALLFIFVTGLTGVPAAAIAIAMITPTAPSGYILARQLGGDAPTMASIITLQTFLAFLVMPAFMILIVAPLTA